LALPCSSGRRLDPRRGIERESQAWLLAPGLGRAGHLQAYPTPNQTLPPARKKHYFFLDINYQLKQLLIGAVSRDGGLR
jgi:hypothetical protein